MRLEIIKKNKSHLRILRSTDKGKTKLLELKIVISKGILKSRIHLPSPLPGSNLYLKKVSRLRSVDDAILFRQGGSPLNRCEGVIGFLFNQNNF